MLIRNHSIDGGNGFDWGKASSDYARYRDIYPPSLYQKLTQMGLCVSGQNVLDLGTGTGVLPRNLYATGARFTGADISEGQIAQARRLAADSGMDISFLCCETESLDFPDASFDVITACQCFFYFDHMVLAPKAHSFLKPGGKLAVVYMAWLPFEDPIAGESERLILKYNPAWTGCGETRRPIDIPEIYGQYFTLDHQEVYDAKLPFTRESWNGRIKACRGVEASLSAHEVAAFEAEHKALLSRHPETFDILHYVAITVLRRL